MEFYMNFEKKSLTLRSERYLAQISKLGEYQYGQIQYQADTIRYDGF